MALSYQRLKESLHYAADTGVFSWVKPTGNRTKAGEAAGRTPKRNGYLYIGIDGERYLAHRLAWFFVHGQMPSGDIDHINADRLDNRLSNLRCVTQQGNNQNIRHARSHSKSGVLGVHQGRKGQWLAHITLDGRSRHLGSFKTVDAAQVAYLSAKRALHPTCSI